MPKKKPIKGKPKVHPDLEGFEIKVNEFGEIIQSMPVDELNKFLDKKLRDKKLRDKKLVDRDDLDVVRDEEEEDDEPEIDEETLRKLDEDPK